MMTHRRIPARQAPSLGSVEKQWQQMGTSLAPSKQGESSFIAESPARLWEGQDPRPTPPATAPGQDAHSSFSSVGDGFLRAPGRCSVGRCSVGRCSVGRCSWPVLLAGAPWAGAPWPGQTGVLVSRCSEPMDGTGFGLKGAVPDILAVNIPQSLVVPHLDLGFRHFKAMEESVPHDCEAVVSITLGYHTAVTLLCLHCQCTNR